MHLQIFQSRRLPPKGRSEGCKMDIDGAHGSMRRESYQKEMQLPLLYTAFLSNRSLSSFRNQSREKREKIDFEFDKAKYDYSLKPS